MALASFPGANKSFYSYSRGTMALLLLFMMTMLRLETTMGAQYTVGDSIGWGLGNNLQSWATQFKFHVGDDLYFPYPPGQHSVLLVAEEDYKSCNIENPITSDNGMGDMVITLDSEETYFFICGVPGHCEQGLRLTIPVEHEESIAPPPPPPKHDLPPPPKDDPPPPHEPEAPPPPKEEEPPPQHEPEAPPPPKEEDPPPPAETLTPPDSPPDSHVDAPILTPPYYSKDNTFHRNSSPKLSITTLASATTIIFSILCTLVSL